MYRSIDLFAGIGGIRKGFDNAFGNDIETVFVSEWDIPAQKTYRANFNDEFDIAGDITEIEEKDIPEFDICLAGFPCQAFSMAGKHGGFNDDYKGRCRGTLFQDVVRICEYHKPKVIFCENVKGLTIHDRGRTFKVIKGAFEEIGYKVFYEILNSKDFGVPQNRERIYLVCFRNDIAPETFDFPKGSGKETCIRDILDPAPVPSKYYLSDVYVQTLRNHRARHAAAGHGFGYVIRELDGIAGTIVCGGMGREGNLIIDEREHSMIPTTHIKGEINKESIRKMTPREWARLQGFPEDFKLELADTHLYKQFGNSVTVNVIEAIANEIRKVLSGNMASGKANRGEWGEPYVVLRVLGDGKLYMSDEEGNKNPNEWMNIMEVIRQETKERLVIYHYDPENTMVDIDINGVRVASIPAEKFDEAADQLAADVLNATGRTFSVSQKLSQFLRISAYMEHLKAKSIDKNDIYLTVADPRSSIVRNRIGFSIKTKFGQNPTLFNTAPASGARYEVIGMTEKLMEEINDLVDDRGHAAVMGRCEKILQAGCEMKFVGFPIAKRAKCEAFRENLDLIDPRLPEVISCMLYDHFFEGNSDVNISSVTEKIIEKNPCNISRGELKYPYMIKSFLYAAYCGMTASTLWDGKGEVNGGFITVTGNGEVIANYALESEAFKGYLFNNCYLEFPSTSERHGDYAKVYVEEGKYYFNLNFQIRYR